MLSPAAPHPPAPSPTPNPPLDAPAARVEAEFGRGVTIRSADDRFSLNLRARIQIRGSVLTHPGDPESPATEFAVRRARLLFRGHALTKDLTYTLQLGLSNQDTEPDLRIPVRDAYLEYVALRDLSVRAGQMKVPFGRQRVTSSSAMEMVDRSIVVTELNLDRDVGVLLFSKDLFGLGKHLGYSVGVFGGDGRNRLAEERGVLSVARLEIWPFGAFDDYSEGDLKRLSTPRLALGLGGAYNQNSPRPRSTTGTPYLLGGVDYLHLAADAHFKWYGFSLVTEGLYRNSADLLHVGAAPASGGPAPREFSRSAAGYYVQAGQMLTERVQATARWGELWPLRPTDPALLRARELGGGLSYYFFEHALKLQADYFYLFGDALRGGRHQARLQVQLYF